MADQVVDKPNWKPASYHCIIHSLENNELDFDITQSCILHTALNALMHMSWNKVHARSGGYLGLSAIPLGVGKLHQYKPLSDHFR